MGTVVLMIRARGTSHVDPKPQRTPQHSAHDAEAYRQQKHERFEIPFENRFLLHPGALALVPTLEWVKLPDDVMGTVTARSTWAREGLSIATATLVEPRYPGIVTLELANMGQIPIALYPGLRLAQIAFNRVEGETNKLGDSQFNLSFEPVQGTLAKKDEFPFFRARQ
jgi:dCTP deaminase